MEGARRIKILGKVILLLGTLAAVGLWLIVELSGMSKVGVWEQLLGFLILPICFGGAIWAFGWIVEGFLRPSNLPNART